MHIDKLTLTMMFLTSIATQMIIRVSDHVSREQAFWEAMIGVLLVIVIAAACEHFIGGDDD